MTLAEKRLWTRIQKKQVKGHQFYRQKIIGNYIVDVIFRKLEGIEIGI